MISVIVPVYNVENYLKKCVESICNQTYKELQIILVNDGSTDNSGMICDYLAENDKRINVIHKKNGGLSDARNTGMMYAEGDYIAFVDSDDYLSYDALESMVEATTRNNCQIAICNMESVSENGKKDDFYVPVSEETVYKDGDKYKTLRQPSVCNKLFWKPLFDGLFFPVGKYYEDTFIYHILLYRAESVVLTGHTGYWYLQRQGSILGRPRFDDRYFDFAEAVQERMVFLVGHQIPYYSEEACLSMYVAVSNICRYIKKTPENQDKYNRSKAGFAYAYKYLMDKGHISYKQKLRLIMLRYIPRLHTLIYRS